MDCSRRPNPLMMPPPWPAGTVLSPPEPARMREPALVAGSVIGVRAWRVDERGHLWPLSVRTAPPWHPGENLSQCFKPQEVAISPCENPTCPICTNTVIHSTFHAECVCGFYGVFEPIQVPVLNRDSPWYVSGVIEAYGRVVMGPGGFRAAKARVLALCGPHPAWRQYASRPVLGGQWRDVPQFPSMVEALVEYPVTNPMEYLT